MYVTEARMGHIYIYILSGCIPRWSALPGTLLPPPPPLPLFLPVLLYTAVAVVVCCYLCCHVACPRLLTLGPFLLAHVQLFSFGGLAV